MSRSRSSLPCRSEKRAGQGPRKEEPRGVCGDTLRGSDDRERRDAKLIGTALELLDRSVRVECYAGSRGEETPRRLLLGAHRAELTVLNRWISEAAEGGSRRRWFRVRLERGTTSLVYYDEALDAWFSRAPGQEE